MKQALIIDDDAEMRETLCDVLRDLGYETSSAGNGREALDMLLAADVLPAIILVDLMMPVLDGWQFCEERLKEPRLASIPVVVMTASVSTRAEPPRGIVASIQKPFGVDALVELLERWSGHLPNAANAKVAKNGS